MSGSPTPGGSDWWMASDGLWYPPTMSPGAAHPGAQQAPAAIPQFTGTGGAAGSAPEGFFARLFDFSMSRFITPSIIKALFILSVTLWSLSALGAIAIALDRRLIIAIPVIPVLWLFGVVYSRVILELIVVFFRIEENTRTKR